MITCDYRINQDATLSGVLVWFPSARISDIFGNNLVVE